MAFVRFSPIITDIASAKKLSRPSWMDQVLKEARGGYLLARKASYHGIRHWEKVERNAIALAKLTPGCDADVVRLFPIIHDSKRGNEDHDPKHGDRSAAYAKRLFDQGKLKITNDQLHILAEACRFHNDGKVSCDPTIGACWDADRLDLPRVGIIPDPKLLSTKAGKLLQEVAKRPLVAAAATSNGASLRVLRKCGFVVEQVRIAPASDRFPECEEAVLVLRQRHSGIVAVSLNGPAT